MRDPDRRELIEQLLLETSPDRTGLQPGTDRELAVLIAAALLAASSNDLLVDAMRLATSTPDRQLVAITAAHLAGDHDRVDALASDHLIDHPPRPVLAWIVARSRSATTTDPGDPHHV